MMHEPPPEAFPRKTARERLECSCFGSLFEIRICPAIETHSGSIARRRVHLPMRKQPRHLVFFIGEFVGSLSPFYFLTIFCSCFFRRPGVDFYCPFILPQGSVPVSTMKDRCLEVLGERFHFPGFREGQEEIIRTLLSGRDAVVVMPTGSGKSLCYQLPALLFEGVTLVVSPLIALMKDQVDGLVVSGIPATFINSQLVPSEQIQRLREVREGRFKLVYIAPERFRNQAFMEGIRNCPIAMVAVDEAHCVSEWGHDFRPDYLRLKEAIGKVGQPPVAALTATATPEVRRDIVLQLGLREPASFVAGFDRPNLRLQVLKAGSEEKKIAAIHSLLERGSRAGSSTPPPARTSRPSLRR